MSGVKSFALIFFTLIFAWTLFTAVSAFIICGLYGLYVAKFYLGLVFAISIVALNYHDKKHDAYVAEKWAAIHAELKEKFAEIDRKNSEESVNRLHDRL